MSSNTTVQVKIKSDKKENWVTVLDVGSSSTRSTEPWFPYTEAQWVLYTSEEMKDIVENILAEGEDDSIETIIELRKVYKLLSNFEEDQIHILKERISNIKLENWVIKQLNSILVIIALNVKYYNSNDEILEWRVNRD
ncbi:MAG: hypothetical protein LBV53_02990 [Mycoplasmataceae bacterium]|nr:hypothetical protein [Mycoplasmataceae bacterium]